MTDVAPPHPHFYLEQAAASARNIRAWIGRYSKLHPEPREPGFDEYISNRVNWVTGVLDDLDRQLMRAGESVEYHLPRHQPRVESAGESLNIHRLETLEKLAKEISAWAMAATWTERGPSLDDLARLKAIQSNIAENVRHLLAQAEQVELAQ